MLEYEIKDAKTANLNEIFFDKNTNKMSYKNSLGIVTILPSDDSVKSVVAGTNVTVDNTDPANPVVSASGGGGASGGFHTLSKSWTLGNPGTFGTSAAINAASLSSNALTANNIQFALYKPQISFTSTALYIQCGGAVAGALARICIYDDNNGLPKNLLYVSTDIDLSTTGNKQALVNFDFVAGNIYYVGVHSSSTALINHININSILPIFNFAGTQFSSFRKSSQVFANGTPAELQTVSYTNSNVPFVGILV
jgi:hypothetical protein